MHFFKIVFAFLAVGGATYAFIKLNETPPWLKYAGLLMAVAAVIVALPELPRGIDALKESANKIAEMFPSRPSASASASTPTYTPPTYTPSAPTYTPPTYTAPTYTPPVQTYTPPPPKCAALVMSNAGGWGGSAGRGLTCNERVERALNTCNTHVIRGECGNRAASSDWVAGVHCVERNSHGYRRNSFAASGESESAAFQRAFSAAASRGFANCKRRVAISSNETTARRYD